MKIVAEYLCRMRTVCLTLLIIISRKPDMSTAIPLQWEQVKPIGDGPPARYSHCTVTFTSSQGIIYLFGGFSGLSPMDCSSGCKFYNDLWLYDAPAQGWEEIILSGQSSRNCTTNIPQQASKSPTPRAEHAMASHGPGALMCGGYTRNSTSGEITFIQDQNGLIECWWLFPIPNTAWYPSGIQPFGSTGPSPRLGHSLVFDPVHSNYLLFGGRDATYTILNDCWRFNATVPFGDPSFQWLPCVNTGATAPSPRFGHGTAVFRGALYVIGGFASDGLSGVVAQNDMWTLDDYAGNGSWARVMPASASLAGRAYFGSWQSGFLVYVAGGEGASGTLEDTWSFNFYTKVWSVVSSQDVALAGSRFHVAMADGRTALSFGGKSAKGVAMGKLFAFTAETGWTLQTPAGDRPARRSGHVAAYDATSDRMIIALGMDATHSQLTDIWALDLASNTWSCLAGEGITCVRGPQLPPSGPGPLAFSASCQSKMHLFVFGGTSWQCASGGVWPASSGELWALNIATVHWSRVQPSPTQTSGIAAFAPSPRLMAALVSLERQEKLKAPLLLIGGASSDCLGKGCDFPIPSNEIWIIDSAHMELGRGDSDLVAEFDGDDIIEIKLPSWCGLVSSMNILWIDFWVLFSSYAAVGGKPMMLMDSYADGSPVLRWFLEGSVTASNDAGTSVVLVLVSSLAESVTVKRWGPLPNQQLLDKWHHIAFTHRFARVSQQGSCNTPAVILVQAHMFLDGEPVPAGDSFLALDIESQLELRAGIDTFSIGGLSSDAADGTSSFMNFVGAIDNLRIWWPPCPAENDPSRCNPYAFLYPILEDDTRAPVSGIADADVRLETVAMPLLKSIFLDEINSSFGLLVYEDFNSPSMKGILIDKSNWGGPPACSGSQSYSDACSGCPANCTFAFAPKFDVTCLDSNIFSVLEDPAAQQFYANQGTCVCFHVDTCPTVAQNCVCPAGLERVCTTCQQVDAPSPRHYAGICTGENATFCWSDSDCGGGTCLPLDPQFCPTEFCSAWTCACLKNGTSLALGRTALVASGSGSCICQGNKKLVNMPVISSGPRYPCCTPEFLRGQVCLEWKSSSLNGKTVMTCSSPNVVALDGTQYCGVQSCCLQSGETNNPPPKPEDPEVDPGPSVPPAGPTCTLNGLTQGTWIGTFVSADSAARNFKDIRYLRKSSFRDVEFHGVFLPDLDSMHNPDNSQQHNQESSMALARGTHRHRNQFKVNKPLSARLMSQVNQTGHSRFGTRKLTQVTDQTATLPVIVAMRLAVGKKDCSAQNLLCSEKSAIEAAIQSAALRSGHSIVANQILITSDCLVLCLQQPAPPGLETSARIQLNVSVILTDSSSISSKIIKAKAISSALNSGIDASGLQVELVSTPFLVYCGDGIKQTQTSRVQMSNNGYYEEECDDGYANSLYRRCNPMCQCNSPGFELDSNNVSCVCQQNPSVSLTSTDSNSVQGGLNQIQMNIVFQDEYGFDYHKQPPYKSGPVIITISGLTGSLTENGIVDVICEIPDSDAFACGLDPDINNNTFRINKAMWSRDSGELKFTVLHPFGPDLEFESFLMTVSLQNNMYAQDARTPSISTCNSVREPGMGNVLKASAVELDGPTNTTTNFSIWKVSTQGALSKVLNMSVDPIKTYSRLVFEALQSSVVDQSLKEQLPKGARFAGSIGTAGLNYSLVPGAISSDVSPRIHMSVGLDRDVLRKQGKCMTSPDGHVQICLPGYVGLYEFKILPSPAAGLKGYWKTLTPVDNMSMSLEHIESYINKPGVYAAISTSQCNDVRGFGRAGGDMTCLASTTKHEKATIQLGGLVVSRMPTLARSTRPPFDSWLKHRAYVNNSSRYLARSGWRRLCPGGSFIIGGDCPTNSAAELSWFPGRFGHSVAVVSTERVVIFGGLACGSIDPVTLGCSVKDAVSLADVWELDITVAMNGGDGLKQILLTPSPPGAIGQVSISLPEKSQRILIFGGASQSYAYYAVMNIQPAATSDSEVFVVRDILLRIGTVVSEDVKAVGAISSHSVVLTGSSAIIFGGTVRNSPTSAAFRYALDAVNPALGLSSLLAAAKGPAGRGYAGLVQRNDLSMLLFGGVKAGLSCETVSNQQCCSTRVGLWDVWELDLSSQTWSKVSQMPLVANPIVRAFSACTHFTAFDGSTVLLQHGGIQCGYKQGVTFSRNCSSSAEAGDSACSNRVVSFFQALPIVVTDSELKYTTYLHRKLTASSSIPEARCMHSILVSSFLNELESGLMYGGVSAKGKALSDLWAQRIDLMQFAYCYRLSFDLTRDNAPLSDPHGLLQVLSAQCSEDDAASLVIGCSSQYQGWFLQSGSSIIVGITTTESQFQSCIAPFYEAKDLFTTTADTINSTWSTVVLNEMSDPHTGFATETRFDMIRFQPVSPADGCKTSCVGGFCQPPSGSSETEPTRCYSGNSDCNENYTCSLPGPRHGHSMVLFQIAGSSVVLLFGGETTDLEAKAPALSADLYSLFVEGGSVSWMKLILGYVGSDGAERGCSQSYQNNLGLCPVPRRDAAVVLMENSGGQNGRMLLFGGMTYCQPSAAHGRTCSGSISPMLAYLKGSISDAPMPLDDLWSLSLARITIACISNGLCPSSSRLLWVQIPVAAGAGPSRRWGAGISLNAYTNELFVTGGTAVDNTGKYSESDELFSYLLKEAYYKNCVASGDGLQNALAGQQATFTVVCQDVFGQPAETASVFVSVSGVVTLSPAVNAVDGVTGNYQCTYTAGIAGTYQLEIRVGRGGSSRRELIPSGQYVLTVLPGSTSPGGSVSAGTFLTLSTAGTVGKFTIIAKDALQNRRPGKDVVDVLIYWIEDSAMLPVPGQVQYSITMAGRYSLQISFSGVIGAQTPVNLMVQSAATDLSRTYGYGSVLQSAAGVTSSIYVQTRDGYGNHVLVDPKKYQSGLEEILFELCNSLGDNPAKACSGGIQELSVSVTVAYGNALPGSSGTAYGLYTLTYFPFSDGRFIPLVRHNSTIVVCLFDTSELSEVHDPGAAMADDCIFKSQIDAASSTSSRRAYKLVTLPKSGSHRRDTSSREEFMVVNATFQEPDLKVAMTWSFLGPILAAIVGVTLDLCCGSIIPYLRTCCLGRSKGVSTTGKVSGAVGQIEDRKSNRSINRSLMDSSTSAFTLQPSLQSIQAPEHEEPDAPVITTFQAGSIAMMNTVVHPVETKCSEEEVIWALPSMGTNEVAGPDPWVPKHR